MDRWEGLKLTARLIGVGVSSSPVAVSSSEMNRLQCCRVRRPIGRGDDSFLRLSSYQEADTIAA